MKPEFTLSEFNRMCLEIFSGVAFLHERGIVHRDLKPQNVLLSGPGKRAQIADFGLAKSNQRENMTTGIGTPVYMAPELFDDSGASLDISMFPVDIYALAIILCQLWTKRSPWKGKSPHQIMMQIMKGKRPKLDKFKDSNGTPPIPQTLKLLIESCWHPNREERPNISVLYTQFEKDVVPHVEVLIEKSEIRRSSLGASIFSIFSPKSNTKKSFPDNKTSIVSRQSLEDFVDGNVDRKERRPTDPTEMGMSLVEKRKLKRGSAEQYEQRRSIEQQRLSELSLDKSSPFSKKSTVSQKSSSTSISKKVKPPDAKKSSSTSISKKVTPPDAKKSSSKNTKPNKDEGDEIRFNVALMESDIRPPPSFGSRL